MGPYKFYIRKLKKPEFKIDINTSSATLRNVMGQINWQE